MNWRRLTCGDLLEAVRKKGVVVPRVGQQKRLADAAAPGEEREMTVAGCRAAERALLIAVTGREKRKQECFFR